MALVTPFRAGAIDETALARLVEWQIQRGSNALVMCGSTGEAATLTAAEAMRVVRVAVEVAAGRVPVVGGCTAVATDQSIALAMDAVRAGADGLLCAPPPYVKPTQCGIAAHVRAIAHATDRPIVLYDVPSRVGVAIADATVAGLFEDQLIVALKDATADLSRPPRLRALCGSDLLQLSGDDATAPAYRAMGGAGCISVTANVAPALCAALHRAWDAGDLVTFGRLRDQLDPLHAALFAESNPIPVKAALAELGLCADAVRLPLTRASAATRERLHALLPEMMAAAVGGSPRRHLALAG
ncbi:MAG: 4-hydroxy-tetrahydrodipicolinate synthase [Acetobacteraceae bacterium]|nr:4-hydroxy-tetrahydrodipicolinate synthase [Acetobacteraceae bacterium]